MYWECTPVPLLSLLPPPFSFLHGPTSIPHHIAFPELAMRDRREAAAARHLSVLGNNPSLRENVHVNIMLQACYVNIMLAINQSSQDR